MPDAVHPAMFRVTRPDSSTTDLLNLSRAKAAAKSLAAGRGLASAPPPVKVIKTAEIKSRGKYRVEGFDLGGQSRHPLTDACRQLQALGVAPETEIASFRAGSNVPVKPTKVPLSCSTNQPLAMARSSPALYSAGVPLSSKRNGPLIFSM